MTTLARTIAAPVPATSASLTVTARAATARARVRRVVIRTWAKELGFVALGVVVLWGGLLVLGNL